MSNAPHAAGGRSRPAKKRARRPSRDALPETAGSPASEPAVPVVPRQRGQSRKDYRLQQARLAEEARRKEEARRGVKQRRTFKEILGAMGMMLFSTAGLSLLAWTVISTTRPDLEVALGWKGTPGTAHVFSCERVGKGEYDCRAWFVFDDPARDPITVATVPEAEAGEVFPAALIPEGDRVVPTGARGVVGNVGLLALAPFVLAFVPAILAFGFALERTFVVSLIVGGVVAAVSLVVCIVCVILGSAVL
ncbi:hypothetical protein HS041_31320 [Planomonospora sp. ID67723]|uniref:hypothetical protein n=1 Tax=Planomonospora sp. ID67723 TaxID=2738134 RepID=UPI0018C3771E|nr:hypothetical protein [Planomonospora sp. ID67723]MBG0832199.1 hypothetical protein [Planomonospora sp. ID67723]